MHVVVMAYGPSQLTKRAVNRARKLAGNGRPVFVVPASSVGRDAIASLAGATKVDAVGSAGLRDALTQLTDEPTLLVHDDIVITMRGALALERALADGSRYAVPYTNDPKMDHFLGSLPAGKAAENSLDQIVVPRESKPATLIRPACVAAKASDLAALLTEPLADPYASITSSEHGFVIAGGAVASHSTECVHRLAGTADSDRPLLVAALIVKDEEEMLPDCLASLEAICDRVEVCDTGSSDNTVAIARAAGASIIERDWNDDFGAARNQVLEQCRDAQYVLWIDADERLVCPDPDQTRRYLATYAAEHPAFNVEITNLESDGSELYRFITVRLFHGSGTEFRGALHEAVHRTDDPNPLTGHRFDQIRIDHHGYAKSVVGDREKAKRNLNIAEAQHEADGDARSAIHLARSLSYAEEAPERALELLEESLADAQDHITEAQIKGLMADRCLQLAENRRAFELAAEALQLLPGDDTALGILAKASERLGNHHDFIEVAEMMKDVVSPKQIVKIDHNRLVFRDRLVAAYAEAGEAEKAVDEAVQLLAEAPDALSNWSQLIACLNGHYGGAALDLLVPLALQDSVGGFLEPIIKTYPSGTVADFCAAYVGRSGEIIEATRVGLLAAAMSGNDAAFAAIAPAASELDPFVRVGLADRIASSGRPDLADKLRAEPVVLKL